MIFLGYLKRSVPEPTPVHPVPDTTSAAAIAYHSSNAVGR